MIMKHLLYGLLALLLWGCQAPDLRTDNEVSYFFNRPAQLWEECLPLGNGRIGMMPDGGVEAERILLNEISMWSGSKQDADNPAASYALPTIRRLLFEGRNDEAQQLMYNTFVCKGAGSNLGDGANAAYGSYQLFGYLNLRYHYALAEDTVSNYRRTLNLSEAISSLSFKRGSVHYTREQFTSFAGDIGVIHLLADEDKALPFSLGLSRPEHAEVSLDGHDLLMSGRLPDGVDTTAMKGMRFAAKVRVLLPKGGQLVPSDTSLTVQRASEAIVLISLATDYWDSDRFAATLDRQLAEAERKDYATLRREHTEAYQALFNRVSLQLGRTERDLWPIDKRLAAFAKDRQDPSLAALYFQFGR